MSARASMPTLTPYTFGTMSIGRDVYQIDEDIELARQAMDAGVWFHTSHEYGRRQTYLVLEQAFEEAPSQRPPLIVKVRCDDAGSIRFDVDEALDMLGVERIELAQLCRDRHDHRQVVDDWIKGGPISETCQNLRESGKVGNFIFEVFTGFADDAVRAIEHDLFDAYILYYSLVNREGGNAFHEKLAQSGRPMLALRTLGSGLIIPDRARRRAERHPEDPALALRQRLEPIVEQHGGDWFDFNFRFILSTPNVVTTIGGTSSPPHLERFLAAADDFKPLEPEVVAEVQRIQNDFFVE